MTPRSFWNMVDGWIRREENKERKAWIRCRWQTCNLINVHMPRGKSMSLHRLLKFDWEKESTRKDIGDTYSDEEFKIQKTKKKFNIK